MTGHNLNINLTIASRVIYLILYQIAAAMYELITNRENNININIFKVSISQGISISKKYLQKDTQKIVPLTRKRIPSQKN